MHVLQLDRLPMINGPTLTSTLTTLQNKEGLAERLVKAGLPATSLQGNLSQNRRQEAMDSFRSGRVKVMVATDIAARGIDVSQITHVINYDMPDTADAYIHRIGRTGRAQRTGDAFTLVTGEDNDMIRILERIMGSPLKRETLEGFDYTAAAPPKPTMAEVEMKVAP